MAAGADSKTEEDEEGSEEDEEVDGEMTIMTEDVEDEEDSEDEEVDGEITIMTEEDEEVDGEMIIMTEEDEEELKDGVKLASMGCRIIMSKIWEQMLQLRI